MTHKDEIDAGIEIQKDISGNGTWRDAADWDGMYQERVIEALTDDRGKLVPSATAIVGGVHYRVVAVSE